MVGRLGLVGALVLALAALPGCASGRPAPPAPAALPALGVNVHADRFTVAQQQDLFGRLAAMGATWVRLDVPWYAVEPDRGRTDPAALDRLDRLVGDARAAGLRVLFLGDQAPDWAGGGNGTASHPDAYGAFLGMIAARLRGTGAAYELMNEPDSPGESRQDPADYAHAACAAYRAIRSADPGAVVAAGSLDVTDWAPWLRAAFDAGLGRCFDALSAHPYSGVDVLDRIRALAAERGRPGVPVWVTEFGASTCADPALGCVSTDEQARSLVDTVTALRDRPWVPVAMVYEAADEPAASGPPSEQHFGLFTVAPDGAAADAKPAVAALRDRYRQPGG